MHVCARARSCATRAFALFPLRKRGFCFAVPDMRRTFAMWPPRRRGAPSCVGLGGSACMHAYLNSCATRPVALSPAAQARVLLLCLTCVAHMAAMPQGRAILRWAAVLALADDFPLSTSAPPCTTACPTLHACMFRWSTGCPSVSRNVNNGFWKNFFPASCLRAPRPATA